jgi:hypothetical protein
MVSRAIRLFLQFASHYARPCPGGRRSDALRIEIGSHLAHRSTVPSQPWRNRTTSSRQFNARSS